MADTTQEGQGNPIGMQGDSLEEMGTAQGNQSGSDAFFNELDKSVNGSIIEENTEATQSQTSGPEQVTHANQDNGSNNVDAQSDNSTDWEKRYKDSSREAVKWREQYKQVEQFVPVLDAMKKDSGLVNHVREYLQNGGKPARSVQEQLGLDEDFMFDQQEAMTDPDSDSAKVMNAHVDGMVQQRVNQMLAAEKKRAVQVERTRQRATEEQAFKEKHNMSDADFDNFKARAAQHKMSLDDVNYLLNRDQAAANVAQSTKQDMLNQMKNVQNMPTSASGANSQGQAKTLDKEVFDGILGFDSDKDNLFG
tara:strand:- start:871 stop:1791 length:921 start_codon:yes stop_codon:yes gene_type:complete